MVGLGRGEGGWWGRRVVGRVGGGIRETGVQTAALSQPEVSDLMF